MAARRVIPETDQGLLAWSNNVSARLDGSPESWGVSGDVAAAFALLATQFADAMQTCLPGSRTLSATVEKNHLAALLRESGRKIVSTVRGFGPITVEQLADIGIFVRGGRAPKLPTPAEIPGIQIVSMIGHTVRFKLRHDTRGRRGRPDGCAGAMIWTSLDATPPKRLEDWTLQQLVTRTDVSITFDASVPPGTKVSLCAAWVNPRLQRGQVSPPTTAYVQFGGPMASPQALGRAA